MGGRRIFRGQIISFRVSLRFLLKIVHLEGRKLTLSLSIQGDGSFVASIILRGEEGEKTLQG